MTVPRISVVVPFYQQRGSAGGLPGIHRRADVRPTSRSSWSTTGRPTAAPPSPRPRRRPTRGLPCSRCLTAALATRATAVSSGPRGVPGLRRRAMTPCRRMPTSGCCTRWRIRARTSSPATCSASARWASPSRPARQGHQGPPKTGTHISRTPDAVLRRLGVEQAVPQVVLGHARPGLSRGHGLGGPPPDDPGARAGPGGGHHPRPDLLLARAGHGRAVDHRSPAPTSSNYTDRINALLVIDAFLRSRKPAQLVRQHQRKALVNDVWLYVGELGRTSRRSSRPSS